MRVTIGLTVMTSLCLLAGCNKGAANNSASAPANTVNVVTQPVTPMPETPPAQTATPTAGGAPTGEIQECVRDVQNELPAGTDVNAFCQCAVAGMAQNGGRERPAMEQCATQMGIQPRN